jgi:hypothetical protein
MTALDFEDRENIKDHAEALARLVEQPPARSLAATLTSSAIRYSGFSLGMFQSALFGPPAKAIGARRR